VPRDEVGFRIQVTSANTDEEIDALLATLTWLDTEFAAESPMRKRVREHAGSRR
jgi:8-amino-7-oxononanoate synthase